MTEEQRQEQQIEEIARWIIDSERIVAFTGVGVVATRGAAEQVLSGIRDRLGRCLTERMLQHPGAMPSLKSTDAAA